MSEVDQRLQPLTNALLGGKPEESRQSTNAALAQGSTPNEVLDALVDAVNIVVDLNEVGEYDQSRVVATEGAVNSCLLVLEDSLLRSEGRFNIKAATGPVGVKAGNLLSIAVSAFLRSAGFHCTNLGRTQTALELLRNSEELGVELVVPLLSAEGIEEQLRSFTDALDKGGFRGKFQVIPVAPGLPESVQPPIAIARNSGEAISKATEWALKKKMSGAQNRT